VLVILALMSLTVYTVSVGMMHGCGYVGGVVSGGCSFAVFLLCVCFFFLFFHLHLLLSLVVFLVVMLLLVL